MTAFWTLIWSLIVVGYFIMSQYGYSFKNKYFILGAIGVLGLIFTSGWIQILFGIYTAGCVIGAIKGDN